MVGPPETIVLQSDSPCFSCTKYQARQRWPLGKDKTTVWRPNCANIDCHSLSQNVWKQDAGDPHFCCAAAVSFCPCTRAKALRPSVQENAAPSALLRAASPKRALEAPLRATGRWSRTNLVFGTTAAGMGPNGNRGYKPLWPKRSTRCGTCGRCCSSRAGWAGQLQIIMIVLVGTKMKVPMALARHAPGVPTVVGGSLILMTITIVTRVIIHLGVANIQEPKLNAITTSAANGTVFMKRALP